jgi:ornithine cyclodeaminase
MVTVHDTMHSKAEEFAGHLKKDLPDTEIRIARNPSELLESSDVIMTATNTPTPLFPDIPSLFEGKTFVGIGSYRPDMREYPDALFKAVPNIFVDTEHALSETGDLIDPLNSGILKEETVSPLGKLLSGRSALPVPGSGVFFKSVGYAAFDMVTARYLVERGKSLERGMELSL